MSEDNGDNIKNDNKNININNKEENFSKEDLENNLLQSNNSQSKNQEEDELENNFINYEINNEDENFQNNMVINSNEFSNENNQQENYEDNENEINQEKYNNNDDGNNNIEMGGENEQDEEMHLISLNDISLCQCCKFHFNSKDNLPYLLKCGHFFCSKCINQYFKDEKGINCPSDGLVAKTIKELKLLKNLIIVNDNNSDKNINDSNNEINKEDNILGLNNDIKNKSLEIEIGAKNQDSKYCSIHKKQKLTHINCEDNKMLCIYCAFELLKNNQSCEIKEIKEKIGEYKENIKNIIDNIKNYLEDNKKYINNFKKNKDEEIKKIDNFYQILIEYLNNKKNSNKDKINIIYENSIKKIEKNIKLYNETIDKANKCNDLIERLTNEEYIIFDIIKNYNNLYNLFNSQNNVDQFEYAVFKNDNEKEVLNYLNNITEIEIKNEFLNYKNNEIKEKHKNKNYLSRNYSSDINLNKYNFCNNLKAFNIKSNYDYTHIFTNNFPIGLKYNSFSLNNQNDYNNMNYLQNMPIHESYLFHRNAYKDNNYVKEVLFDKNNSFNNINFYKTDSQFLIKNKYI